MGGRWVGCLFVHTYIVRVRLGYDKGRRRRKWPVEEFRKRDVLCLRASSGAMMMCVGVRDDMDRFCCQGILYRKVVTS